MSFSFLATLPLRRKQPEEENIGVSAVAKRGLAQSSLLPKSEGTIERQCTHVVLLDADPYPVCAPASEAGFKGGLQKISSKSLAPAIGIDQERKLDGVGFKPVNPQHDETNGITLQRFGDECLRPAKDALPRQPRLHLTGDILQRASRSAPPPAAHHDWTVEPAMEQGRVVSFDRAEIDRLAGDHVRLRQSYGMCARGN